MNERNTARIVRYSAEMRINHWIVAGSFVLLALSGLALFHPALFWLGNLFGGGPWTRILHPFIGLVMAAAFWMLAARMWRDNHWQERDSIWLANIRDVVAKRERKLPDVGRYNAGQKLIFFTFVACLIILLLSGIVIWRAYFSAAFPIGMIRLASLLHALFAFAMILAIIVHIYAAVWVKGSIRAMTRGWVTPGWAWKHHRAWFREVTKDTAPK